MRLLAGAALALGALGLLVYFAWTSLQDPAVSRYAVPDNQVYLQPGLQGPAEDTAPPAEAPAKGAPEVPARYRGPGAPNRLAVLLTDRDSSWLGLAHGLKTIGVPFIITEDYREALRHKVVIAYPVLSGKLMSKEALSAVARHPQQGGVLIAQHVLGGELYEVFGFADAQPVKESPTLRLQTGNAATADFTDPAERRVRLSSGGEQRASVRGAYAYTGPRFPPLATYEDGRAAILERAYAAGRAVVVGVDIGHLILTGHNARQDLQHAETYANGFEPSIDVVLRLLRHWYQATEPRAATLGTVPDGKSLAVVLTHDIDYSRSLHNALEYARQEHDKGVAATFFMQTKYIRDWNDEIFFDGAAAAVLAQLRGFGMELGSHSVSHAYTFHRFPLGDGRERYPAYRPFVKERSLAYNGSVLGELRVSRFLLDQALPGQRTRSFRPGHLRNPENLPEALAATGYRYSSTMTANYALTHFPFQLNRGRGSRAEVDVYEIPIALEDELKPPLAERLPQALALAEKVARYGGSFVVLIHPDITGAKLDFQGRLIDALKPGAWFGTLEQYGDWWAARDRVEVDWETAGETLVLRSPSPLRWLEVRLPPGFAPVAPLPAGVRAAGGGILVDRLEGTLRVPMRANAR